MTNLRDEFEHIRKDENVRQSLISIKAKLRNGQGLQELKTLFQEEPQALLSKLRHEDAKVRKTQPWCWEAWERLSAGMHCGRLTARRPSGL